MTSLTERLTALADKVVPGPRFNVVNDLVGGRMIATVDKPASAIGRPDEIVIAEFLSEADAAFVAALSPEVVRALVEAVEAADKFGDLDTTLGAALARLDELEI